MRSWVRFLLWNFSQKPVKPVFFCFMNFFYFRYPLFALRFYVLFKEPCFTSSRHPTQLGCQTLVNDPSFVSTFHKRKSLSGKIFPRRVEMKSADTVHYTSTRALICNRTIICCLCPPQTLAEMLNPPLNTTTTDEWTWKEFKAGRYHSSAAFPMPNLSRCQFLQLRKKVKWWERDRPAKSRKNNNREATQGKKV